MIILAAILSIGLTTIYQETKESSKVTASVSSTVKENKQVTYVVIVKKANVRKGAGTSYDVYKTYEKGDELVATGDSKKDNKSTIWYEVYVDGKKTAWISEITVKVKE
ncbi:hypothetical protein P261_02117 [Lachnospiraceae bacterium TWA4]|nr:hypothetical protein P261_02117 [Lachnospiraceae bacterium TWA4]